jgi:hypothetical protein
MFNPTMQRQTSNNQEATSALQIQKRQSSEMTPREGTTGAGGGGSRVGTEQDLIGTLLMDEED